MTTKAGAILVRLGPALLAAGLTLVVAAAGVLQPVELLFRDAVLRARRSKPAAFVALVLVDEEALRVSGPWPWSRRRLAELTDGVRESGARGIVCDLLLPEPREGDEELAAALAKAPSVLAVGVDDRQGWLLPAPALRSAAAPGHVSFETDRDGVVRRFLSTLQLSGRSLPALAVAGAHLVDPARPIAVGVSIRPGFSFPDAPRLSASLFRAGAPPRPELRGRIVFVGANAAGIGDRALSPASPRGIPEPGVFIQAAACESLLAGDLLRPVSPLVAALVSGLAALLASRGKGRALAFGAALLPLAAGVMMLRMAGLELHAVTGASMAVLVSAAGSLSVTARLRRERAAVERRVRHLTALTRGLHEGRRDDAEARRVVAHELKTPLTSVKGLAQLLSDFDLSDDERRHAASLLSSETSRLSEMVETLLDLERMKLRDFASAARPVAFTSLVERRAEILRRGSARTLRVALAEGVTAFGDAALLERVVENLVGNAVKFSPDGTDVELRLSTPAEGGALLEVADRGPGVSPGDREKVFRRFARAGDATAVPGLGLGLAFVAEIVAWHGGRVEVHDNPGGGSVFRVLLPAPPAAKGAA